MKSCLVAGLLVVLFGLTGVAQEKTQRDSGPKVNAEPKASVVSTNKAAGRETYTVIGYLEKRDRVITSSPVRKARVVQRGDEERQGFAGERHRGATAGAGAGNSSIDQDRLRR